jgi:hypothetical protein
LLTSRCFLMPSMPFVSPLMMHKSVDLQHHHSKRLIFAWRHN